MLVPIWEVERFANSPILSKQYIWHVFAWTYSAISTWEGSLDLEASFFGPTLCYYLDTCLYVAVVACFVTDPWLPLSRSQLALLKEGRIMPSFRLCAVHTLAALSFLTMPPRRYACAERMPEKASHAFTAKMCAGWVRTFSMQVRFSRFAAVTT